MSVNINAVPLPTAPITNARIAKSREKNVDATAASCGLLPNGTATNRDQLASERPNIIWMTKTRPPEVLLKMRRCQMIETIIHAGRYASDILMCHDLAKRKAR